MFTEDLLLREITRFSPVVQAVARSMRLFDVVIGLTMFILEAWALSSVAVPVALSRYETSGLEK